VVIINFDIKIEVYTFQLRFVYTLFFYDFAKVLCS
jgi:hypothetical protein